METLVILDIVIPKKSEFAGLILDFEKLGLELDNHGRTTKNYHHRIYGLWVPVLQELLHHKSHSDRCLPSKGEDKNGFENYNSVLCVRLRSPWKQKPLQLSVVPYFLYHPLSQPYRLMKVDQIKRLFFYGQFFIDRIHPSYRDLAHTHCGKCRL
jgi:hypothetical protein